jgi:hypothetical protein
VEPKKKKELKPSTSSSILNNTATVSSGSSSAKASAVNEQIADLLFELQGDNQKDHVLQTNPEKSKCDAKEILAEKQAESPRFLGVMGKCMIPGCDVHTVTLDGNIIEHFSYGKQIDPAFSKARQVLANATSNTVGVLVYDSGIEIIFLDGTIKSA